MKLHPAEIRHRMAHFQDVLRRAGIKLTHQRIEIFREVAQTEDHPDAETVYWGVDRRIPTISLDTVYRTLLLLVDLCLISSRRPGRERMRFDASMGPHHHFVCTQCGLVRDCSIPKLDELKIPDAVRKAGRVEKTQVEFRGLCTRCSANIKKKKNRQGKERERRRTHE